MGGEGAREASRATRGPVRLPMQPVSKEVLWVTIDVSVSHKLFSENN